MDTSTPASAREHARAQAGARADTMATIPVSGATDLPEGIDADALVWDETLGAGGYASRVLARGTRLRLVDLDADACVQLWAYNAATPVERLNVADTTKVQWNAYLGEGALLLSDMGRVLMSITSDTAGTHDALCGHSTARSAGARFGESSNHGPHPNARDRLLLALTRHGLGRADVMANVNLFRGARVEEDGSLVFTPGAHEAGAHVELRADMDVLVVLTVTPHVLDPSAGYPAGRVRVLATTGPPAGPDDPCRTAGPEAGRAFDNTEDLVLR